MTGQNSLDALLGLIASVFDAYSVVVFQFTGKGKSARMTASFSLGEQVDAAASISPGKGLLGWILRNKAPVLVDSLEENQVLGYYQAGCEPDIRSFMGCPIPGGGALCIDSRQRNAFPGKRQKLLHLFAAMIPRLQQTDSRDSRERTLSSYLAALDRMVELRLSYGGWSVYLRQLLALLAETTGFSYAAFASRTNDNSRYIVEGEHPLFLKRQDNKAELPVTAGIVGWVLRNGEPVLNEGGENGAGTLIYGKHPQMPEFSCSICLPVNVDNAAGGVLCLADKEPRVFTQELRIFVRLVADDLARMLDAISLRYRSRPQNGTI